MGRGGGQTGRFDEHNSKHWALSDYHMTECGIDSVAHRKGMTLIAAPYWQFLLKRQFCFMSVMQILSMVLLGFLH